MVSMEGFRIPTHRLRPPQAERSLRSPGTDGANWRAAGKVFLVAVAAVLLAGAASKEMTPLRKVEVLSEKDGVPPGGTLALAVRVTLNRDFHVNSHLPSQKFLIPTAVEAESTAEAEFSEWVYPEGEAKGFPFSEEPLRVYEGTFLVRGSVRVPSNGALGERHLALRLRYQACTQEKCLPPKVEVFACDLPVVAVGTRTRSLHPDLFASDGK
jgi:hypothetical protein